MLALCDFEMSGGSESISEKLTGDASGNQQLVNLNSDIEETFMFKPEVSVYDIITVEEKCDIYIDIYRPS